MAKKKEQDKPKGVRVSNRRARRDFEILEVVECGIQLTGTEVKSMIPLAMYFVRGWAKCEIGVAIGRRSYDKRDAIKKKQQIRDMARDLGRKYR